MERKSDGDWGATLVVPWAARWNCPVRRITSRSPGLRSMLTRIANCPLSWDTASRGRIGKGRPEADATKAMSLSVQAARILQVATIASRQHIDAPRASRFVRVGEPIHGAGRNAKLRDAIPAAGFNTLVRPMYRR
jgi:hypothetical protein